MAETSNLAIPFVKIGVLRKILPNDAVSLMLHLGYRDGFNQGEKSL